MKLQVGYYYKTRNGCKVFIHGKSQMDNMYIGEVVSTSHAGYTLRFNEDGTQSYSHANFDIIEEWKESIERKVGIVLQVNPNNRKSEVDWMFPEKHPAAPDRILYNPDFVLGYKEFTIKEGDGMIKVELQNDEGVLRVYKVPSCWGEEDIIDIPEGKFKITNVRKHNNNTIFEGELV